jgi:DNA-binding transcriptional LysR family regulator
MHLAADRLVEDQAGSAREAVGFEIIVVLVVEEPQLRGCLVDRIGTARDLAAVGRVSCRSAVRATRDRSGNPGVQSEEAELDGPRSGSSRSRCRIRAHHPREGRGPFCRIFAPLRLRMGLILCRQPLGSALPQPRQCLRQRLLLSPSAMSRALARLRKTTGDALLVRAGRGLVPTPRALELRERVGQVVQDGEAVLRRAEKLNLKQLVRTFMLRTSEGFVENFGPDLIARVGEEAPGVRLRFAQKPNKDSAPLRDGTVDLETGAVGKTTGPEVRAQALFRDRFIGVVRLRHSLSQGKITPFRYATGRHILVSRRGLEKGPIDEALNPFGLQREIVTIVGGFSTALALARASDLIASVPERHTGNLRAGMHSFPLPISMPEITVSLLWHPRLDADPAHRWLRGCVRDACAERPPESLTLGKIRRRLKVTLRS